MKKRLENLGEVNPTAIEAFQEMKKRYEFILEQKNDLVTAKESLMQTIAEVESTANQKFLETFHQVKDNFIKTETWQFLDCPVFQSLSASWKVPNSSRKNMNSSRIFIEISLRTVNVNFNKI